MNLSSRKNIKAFFAFLGVFNGGLLVTVLTILTETKNVVIDWVTINMSISKMRAEWLLFFGINIVAIIVWILVRFIWLKWYNGTMQISIDDDSRGQRIEDFQSLRDQAKKSVMIMGIGMSNVSQDQGIVNLLKKGINVNFLIMDPEILIDLSSIKSTKGFTDKGILIDNKKFSDFYSKDDYCEIIEHSIANFRKLISDQEKRHKDCQDGWGEGSIEVRKYSYYVPMNVTISDMDNDAKSKLVAEFCLPFSTKRIRTKLSHGSVKKLIIQQIRELWNNAHPVT